MFEALLAAIGRFIDVFIEKTNSKNDNKEQ